MDLSKLEDVVGDLIDLPEPERSAALRRLERQDPEVAALAQRLLSRMDGALKTPPEQGCLPEDARLDEDDLIGANFGEFTLIRLVGAGGMGRVYEARQRAPERRVAVKVISERLVRAGATRRFVQEGQVLGSLEHPAICRVIAAGAARLGRDSIPFIAMEFVDGKPLTEAAVEMTVKEKIEVMCRVCDAVEYAHRRGVIHRDLKPGNILVGRDAELGLVVRVVDFGLARLLDAEPGSLTGETGAVLGTPDYMSPEQLGAPVGEASTRSDVFALGVILYELLSGRRPFPKRSGAAVLKEGEVEAPPLRSVSRGIHPELELIVGKAMAVEAEERYESPGPLAADLRAYLECRPVSVHAPSVLYRARKFVRRHRALSIGVMIAILVSGLGAAGVVYGLSAAGDHRQRTTASLYRTQIERAQLDISAGHLAKARKELEGAPARLRGWEWRYLRSLCDEQKDAGVRGIEWELMLGTSGRRPYRLERERGLMQMMNLDTLELAPGIPGFGPDNLWRCTFTGDGRYLVTAGMPEPAALRVYDSRVNEKVGERIGFKFEDRGFDVNRRGDRLVIGGRSGVVRVFTIPGLELVIELKDEPEIVNCTFSPDETVLAVSSPSNSLNFYRVETGERISRVEGLRHPLDWQQFCGDWLVALCYAENTLVAIDPLTGKVVQRAHSPGPVGSLAAFPDGSRVVLACNDGTVYVYPIDVAREDTWSPVLALRDRHCVINSVYVSPDGRRIFADAATEQDVVWDAGDRE